MLKLPDFWITTIVMMGIFTLLMWMAAWRITVVQCPALQ